MFEKLKTSQLYNFIYPLFKYLEVFLWHRRGGTPPTPHLVKEKTVNSYANIYKLNTLVETGTYLGIMVDAQINKFDKIYSVELNDELFKLAKNKFKKYKHINIIKGDSKKVLPKILTKLKDPVLFWLDAHYSGGITSKGKFHTPIIEELKLILGHKIKNHTILIDDANLFIGVNGYPTVKELKNILIKRKRSIIIKNNIIVVY